MTTALQGAWRRTLARHGPDRALVEAADGREYTFRELAQRASAWRRGHLPAAADLRGRAVVFAVPNGVCWLEIFLALGEAGAVAVPLDAAEPPAAQRRLAEGLRAAYWWDGYALQTLGGARRFRDRETALVKLTSGTTGQPRPLVFTGAQLLADARQVTATMAIGTADLNYGLIPFGHSYGLGNLTLPLVAQGVPAVCGSAALPQAIAADFARWRPTVFPAVPAIWRALAAAELPAGALASLRLGISAGAPLPAEVAKAFAERFGRRLHGFYGSSETGGIAFDRDGKATLAGGVGRPMRGVSVVPRRGWRPEVSSAAVCTHGNRRRMRGVGAWLMPDRVMVDASGRLTLLGRRGATVKVAGRRVSLAEVEARLRRLEGVRDVWVGVGSGAEPQLGAVLATNRPVVALRAVLQADMAAWKIPKRLQTVKALPLTARGKVDAASVRRMLFGGGPGPNTAE